MLGGAYFRRDCIGGYSRRNINLPGFLQSFFNVLFCSRGFTIVFWFNMSDTLLIRMLIFLVLCCLCGCSFCRSCIHALNTPRICLTWRTPSGYLFITDIHRFIYFCFPGCSGIASSYSDYGRSSILRKGTFIRLWLSPRFWAVRGDSNKKIASREIQ